MYLQNTHQHALKNAQMKTEMCELSFIVAKFHIK